jgi:hypothetical protein
MQYLLMIAREDAYLNQASPQQREATTTAFMAYTQALRNAGVLLGGNALQPSTSATTVRVRDGKTHVLDGPFADTKEQLGGYYLIDVPDLDAALAWAARCPGAAFGTIEVRPVMETPASAAAA